MFFQWLPWKLSGFKERFLWRYVTRCYLRRLYLSGILWCCRQVCMSSLSCNCWLKPVITGSVLAAYMVQWSRGGRKFAMAFSTITSGIFLLGLTAARNGTQINVLTCFAALFENAFCTLLSYFSLVTVNWLLILRWCSLFVLRAVLSHMQLLIYSRWLCSWGFSNTVSRNRRCFGSRGLTYHWNFCSCDCCAYFLAVHSNRADLWKVYSKAADTPDGPVYASAAIFVAWVLSTQFL